MALNAYAQLRPAAIALIKHVEGCRLDAYRDAVGVWTIGYGHTRGVHRGMTITPERADRYLRQDLRQAQRDVDRCVKVPLNDNEYGALVSLVFNIGGRAFKRSTCLRELNTGNRQAAADAMQLFDKGTVYGFRKTLKGLVRRRRLERALFDYPDNVPVTGGYISLAHEAIPLNSAEGLGTGSTLRTILAALGARPHPPRVKAPVRHKKLRRSVAAVSVGTAAAAIPASGATSWAEFVQQGQNAWHELVSSGVIPTQSQISGWANSASAKASTLWHAVMTSDAMPTKAEASHWITTTLARANDVPFVHRAEDFAATHQSVIWIGSALAIILARHMARRYVFRVLIAG